MRLEDLGVLEDSDIDENDPSEAWVESASLSSGIHTPNGPLGSDFTFTSLSGTSQAPLRETTSRPKKKRPPKTRENPLSSSVQENF